MGLWSKIKGWLNIGGVSVKLWKFREPLRRSDPVMPGAVLLKSKSDKKILSLEVRIIEEIVKTKGSGETKETETETNTLGSVSFPGKDPGIGYPFELKAGEQKEQPFEFHVAVTERLRKPAGMFSLSNVKTTFYLIAEAKVEGAVFPASDKQKVKTDD